jgi:hypothetical protein
MRVGPRKGVIRQPAADHPRNERSKAVALNVFWLIMLAFAPWDLWRAMQPVMTMLRNRPRDW